MHPLIILQKIRGGIAVTPKFPHNSIVTHSPSALTTSSTPLPVRQLVATTMAFGLTVFTSFFNRLTSTSIAVAKSTLLMATTLVSMTMNGCLTTMYGPSVTLTTTTRLSEPKGN